MIHDLKTYPPYFSWVLEGIKQFEIRKDDRGFNVGDELLLREYVEDGIYEDDNQSLGGFYTGRFVKKRVIRIIKGSQFGIQEGFCVMCLANTNSMYSTFI